LSPGGLDLIVPQIKLLKAGIVKQSGAKRLQASVTESQVVPFKTQLLNRIVLLEELGKVADSSLTDVVTLEV